MKIGEDDIGERVGECCRPTHRSGEIKAAYKIDTFDVRVR